MVSKILKLLAISVVVILLVVPTGWYISSQLSANNQTNAYFDNNPSATPTLQPNVLPTSPTTKSPTTNPLTPTSPPVSQSPTVTPNNSIEPGTTPAPTSTATQPVISPTVAPTNPTITPPISTPTAPPTQPVIVTFDFDTGTPALLTKTSTPFSQTKDGITATFSSPSGAAFSVQSYDTTFFKLSQLQGKYLYDNNPLRDILEIKFSQPIRSITFTFATFESHGAPTDLPSNMTINAYMDSTATPVGSATGRGTWPTSDAYPQGTLTYDSGATFNLVGISLPFQAQNKAVDYLIDTIIVKTA